MTMLCGVASRHVRHHLDELVPNLLAIHGDVPAHAPVRRRVPRSDLHERVHPSGWISRDAQGRSSVAGRKAIHTSAACAANGNCSILAKATTDESRVSFATSACNVFSLTITRFPLRNRKTRRAAGFCRATPKLTPIVVRKRMSWACCRDAFPKSVGSAARPASCECPPYTRR
eukprot:scaffold90042_cov66-Phaeocystis_antarctica.AAC.1